MAKIFKKIKLGWQEIVLILSTFIYIVYFTLASFLKYENYYNGRFDLGNMAQTVWNTVHGNIFMLTDPNGTREISRLAFHADFILIFLAPFYLLWEDPRMLLLIQTVVLSVGGIFIYLIAHEKLKNKNISLALALCYFLSPAVNYTNLFDFHAVTLATTFLLGAFYFILKSKYKLVLLFLILAGITKEQVWLINALIGLYLVFGHKQKGLGTFIFAASSLIFYLLIWIAIPKSLGGEHFALSYYSDYGDAPAKIIKNIFLSPIKTLQTIFFPDRIGYLKQLFIPLGYLSFLAPVYLIFAGPDLGINLLSSNPNLHQIYYQYSSTITPFIFLSAISAIYIIKAKLPEISFNAIAIILVILSLLSAYNIGPLPFAKKPTLDMFKNPLLVRNNVDDFIKSLQANESVSATNNLGSHLSHRNNIYTIPQGVDRADIVMFLITNSTNQKERETLGLLLKDPNYRLIQRVDNFYVFDKKD